ncbi:unnamed protein product [Alternaria alternata]
MAYIERKTTTQQSKPTTPVDSVLAVTPPVTPNATSTAAHRLVSEIREIYTVLSGLSSLAPSEQVNSLLTQLVNLCVVPYSTEFTSCFFRIPGIESLCSNLRLLCSEAEGELEKFWAKRMLNDLSNTTALSVSESLCKRLGYQDNRMSFACEDVTQETRSSTSGWQSCEVVFLAALVGTDTYTKLNILKSMAGKLAPGTLVVARSAQGMRSVLYPVSN